MKYTRITPQEAARMARRDRLRILGLTVSAILVGGLYLYSTSRSADGQDALGQEAPVTDAPAAEEVVELVPFDRPELLARIEDATEPQQEFLETEPLQEVFAYARLQTRRALQAAGMRTLDAEVSAELLAAPAEHRLDALLLRGQVLDVSERPGVGGASTGWMGSLVTDDGSLGYFIVANAPKLQGDPAAAPSIRRGDYVRIDGLFHKVYRAAVPEEVGSEALRTASAPLVLGFRATPSTPPITEELARALLTLEMVRDDEIAMTFEEGTFDLQKWELMAHAEMVGAETDWAAAPELDQDALFEIYEDGEAHRGAPFRIPVSINLDTYSREVRDNPLRLDRITEGWIGNNNWKGAVKTIKWVGPFVRQDLLREDLDDDHRYVQAKGYFFRNILFKNRSGEPRRSPVFVLHELEVYQPEPANSVRLFTYLVLGATLFMVAVIYLLLRADRRKSQQLHEDMVRRRRRRENREPTTA